MAIADVDPNLVGYEGALIGRPAVAVNEEGQGVLAFVESNDGGFQVVATRLVCDGWSPALAEQ
jgi:hypothetical protein